MYLRHHWRVDLLGGLVYSAFAFTLLQTYIVRKEREFESGSSGPTGWARLFKNTFLEHMFDAEEESYSKILPVDHENSM